MRVDFYQLSDEGAPATAALLARKVREGDARLLVVGTKAVLQDVSKALWEAAPEHYLANGMAGGTHDARQPILLSESVEAANGAAFLLIADGRWRDPGQGFERVFYLFDDATIAEARATWKALGESDAGERHFWKRANGRWVEGP